MFYIIDKMNIKEFSVSILVLNQAWFISWFKLLASFAVNSLECLL